jgi:nuclear polyadenylated RNA-binding protein NAB2
MGDDETKAAGEGGEARESEKPTEETMCRFNLNCTKADCAFAHAGPFAPPHIGVDTSVVCEFGVRCKNRHCAGRHPSPAKKFSEMAKADCKFGPSCQNPGCLFKHPDNPPCRNGADCKDEGCIFWHNPVTCKFPECTNRHCPYKHAEGQKKPGAGPIRNKVWQPNGGGAEHVSERKFVDGEEDVETIIPGQTNAESEMQVSV